MKLKFRLDGTVFDDFPPDEKDCSELIGLMLREADGECVSFKKYSNPEINRCARVLINEGLIRGTVIDFEKCSWSRITMKGKFYLGTISKFKY